MPTISRATFNCAALEIPLFSLLDDEKFDEMIQNTMVTTPEQRIRINTDDMWSLSLLNPNKNRKFDFVLMETASGTISGDCVAHPGDEGIFVFQGIMEVSIDGQTYIAKAGDSIYFDSSKDHKWKSVGEESLIAISAISEPRNI